MKAIGLLTSDGTKFKKKTGVNGKKNPLTY
jgi:hypothetical protein